MTCLSVLLFLSFSPGPVSAQPSPIPLQGAEEPETASYRFVRELSERGKSELEGLLFEELDRHFVRFPTGTHTPTVAHIEFSYFASKPDRVAALISGLKILFCYPEYKEAESIRSALEGLLQSGETGSFRAMFSGSDTDLSALTQSAFDAVAKQSKSALESSPGRATAEMRLWRFLRFLHSRDDARLLRPITRETQRFLWAFPDSERTIEVGQYLAQAHRSLGNFHDAVMEYRRLEILFPASEEIRWIQLRRGEMLHEDLGETAFAEEVLGKLVFDSRGDSVEAEARFHIARIHAKDRASAAETVREFEEMIRLFPNHYLVPAALLSMAEVHEHQRSDPQNAIKSYDRLLVHDPDHPRAPDALHKIGTIQRKKTGEIDSAIDSFRRLAREYPDYPESANLLLDAARLAERELSKPILAEEIYRELIEHFPYSKPAREANRRLEALKKAAEKVESS